MLSAGVSVRTNKDAARAVKGATDKYVMDVATAGFNRSQRVIAQEATDTGQLLKSGIPPQRQSDGSVLWGYMADYATDVDQGQEPNWIDPIDPLLGWARRVLGNEGAAYAVREKIAEEGTEGVFFARKAIESMRGYAMSNGMKPLIIDRL